MMTVVIKQHVPAFLTKRCLLKKGILGALGFDFRHTFQMVDFFDIFDSTLRSALTFDIHTRRVPLGLRVDAPVMCSFVFAWPQRAARAGLACPNPRKRDMHGISRRSGHSSFLVTRYRCENVAISDLFDLNAKSLPQQRMA